MTPDEKEKLLFELRAAIEAASSKTSVFVKTTTRQVAATGKIKYEKVCNNNFDNAFVFSGFCGE
jgi:hypothetical protein